MGDRGREGVEQDDPSESAPSEDTTSICSTAMPSAGHGFAEAVSYP